MSTIDLACDLVAIPSHSTDARDERAAGDAVEAWLREHTAATVERDDAPRGGNVIARAGPSGDPDLAFVGHHDVVDPADDHWAADRFRVERRDGRLYGRGTADMKGSLAAAMTAFAAVADDATRPVAFVSFTGEESGGIGCRWAIDHGFSPERAVVLEGSTGYGKEEAPSDGPPGIDVAVAHKGRRALTVEASGTAAHASVGHDADNAIYHAIDAIDRLRSVDPPSRQIAGQRVDGSVAVTEIAGGDAWNVVPETCTVTVDERTIPGGRIDLAMFDAVDVTVDQDLPPMVCADESFVERAVAAASRDRDARRIVKPHATDAGWLADRAGTDCLVIGAAEPGEAHTDDESVSIAAIERCREIYERLVRDLVV
ncbi:M20 family metallopeptidase [Halococcoides cellulosivorans]|uniref:M20 family metallopeptidase n=1 Tax=Halococcoides cellulosivorans TaxID=1679096 RepID=UPI001F340EC9|nr:M20/M25/M40 family metallo-hydrolase [Halococcoides cellulosivorans]